MTIRVAISGITGYTGRALEPLIRDLEPRLLLRHRTAQDPKWRGDSRIVCVDQSDSDALCQVLGGITTVVCLVGTTRAQFAQGNTYEAVDIGIPRALANAAKSCGAKRMILLSSIGAGPSSNAYLQAKHLAEEAVRGSGLQWVILRPSFIAGTGADGWRSVGRLAPLAISPVTRILRYVPGIGEFAADCGPISVRTLAEAINKVIRDEQWDGKVLTGFQLHRIACMVNGC